MLTRKMLLGVSVVKEVDASMETSIINVSRIRRHYFYLEVASAISLD